MDFSHPTINKDTIFLVITGHDPTFLTMANLNLNVRPKDSMRATNERHCQGPVSRLLLASLTVFAVYPSVDILLDITSYRCLQTWASL